MSQKYTGVQIGLHWLVFLLVIVAWLSMDFRHDVPSNWRPALLTLHASCGISVGILMVVRIGLRLRHPAPAIAPKPPVWSIGLAHSGHLAIWLIFIALPVLGVLTVYFKASGWQLFGIPMPVAADANNLLKSRFKSWHELLATLSYWVIGAHALAAILHHVIWHDNTLKRMLPGRD